MIHIQKILTMFFSDEMGIIFIGILQISVVLGDIVSDIPRFGAVGQFKCRPRHNYHFATSFYTRDKNEVKDTCDRNDCDIIIEWTRKSGARTITGWDIGKFKAQYLCQQNPNLKATIIWEKSFNDYMDANKTVSGKKKPSFCDRFIF